MEIPDSGPIFTSDEVKILEEAQIFSPHQTSGKRKVSVVFTTPTSGPSSRSSSGSVTLEWHGFDNRKTEFEVPTEKDSIATLELMGFQRETAVLTHDRFRSILDPNQSPHGLLAFAHGHTRALQAQIRSELSSREALNSIGISPYLQEALTDPSFKDIRGTEELRFWVKAAIETNYMTILSNQAMLKGHAGKGRPKRKSPKSGHEQEEQAERPPESVTVSLVGNVEQDLTGVGLRAPWTTMGPPQESLQDHVTLYKVKSFPLKWNLIDREGDISLSTIMSPSPGDFNGISSAIYLSPNRQTAEQYRQFALRLNPDALTGIITIQIPRAYLENLSSTEIWFSAEWKQFVWHNRRGERTPSNLAWLNRQDLLKGHVLTGARERLNEIAFENIDRDINGDRVLKTRIDQQTLKAVQWAFTSESTWAGIEEQIRGKVHVDIYQPSSSIE